MFNHAPCTVHLIYYTCARRSFVAPSISTLLRERPISRGERKPCHSIIAPHESSGHRCDLNMYTRVSAAHVVGSKVAGGDRLVYVYMQRLAHGAAASQRQP
jgi:hypothetical protein